MRPDRPPPSAAPGDPGLRGDLPTRGPYRAIACDADGTLTWRRRLNARTAAALVRWRAAGGQVILVTGEARADLLHFARTGLFDRIVGENGGILLGPPDWRGRLLGPALAPALVRAVADRWRPLSVGRVLLGTRAENAAELRRAVGPGYRLVRNRKDVMALPAGVSKATGLAAALRDLGLPAAAVVGVGDGENDAALVRACGLGAAVANAVPAVRRWADWVARGRGPAGVVELIGRLLAGDPPRKR
jgi:hydroxymethylpyrimidine pyrophosphatase-like HAD family hydrolase